MLFFERPFRCAALRGADPQPAAGALLGFFLLVKLDGTVAAGGRFFCLALQRAATNCAISGFITSRRVSMLLLLNHILHVGMVFSMRWIPPQRNKTSTDRFTISGGKSTITHLRLAGCGYWPSISLVWLQPTLHSCLRICLETGLPIRKYTPLSGAASLPGRRS